MLVIMFHEDLGEDMRSWIHVHSTLTRKNSVAHANIFHAHSSCKLTRLFSMVLKPYIILPPFHNKSYFWT